MARQSIEPNENNSKEEAYCTMLFTDDYVPGAIVVATQLRALDGTRPILCLVANDAERTRVSDHSIRLLNDVFDELVFVDPVDVGDSPELRLLNRPELRMAATKVRLWELPYARIVYLDADTLPIQPLNGLFDRDLPSTRHIAASPDCGWPDMFNSGVSVLRPDPELARDIISRAPTMNLIDGSDQGLLNQEFKWVRLPFLFNVTANTSYEYAPAYARFRNEIKVLHFVGSQKPWSQLASDSPIVKQWWSVFSETKLGKAQLAPPAHEREVAVDMDKVIVAPPDFWDAKTHAPFKHSRPEGEFLVQRLATMKLDEQPLIIPSTPVENSQTPSELEESVSPLPKSSPSRPRPPQHIYPVYGPSLVSFPFEARLTSPPEREF